MALTVGSAIERIARVAPHAVAATFGDDSITFQQLDARANQVAHALAARGVRAGDRIAWQADTSLAATSFFVALAKLGAVFMPVSVRFSFVETMAVLDYARPQLFVEGMSRGDSIEGFAVPSLTTDTLESEADTSSTARYDGPEPGELDPHVIFFTSGSTGAPKGVVLSHRANWLRSYPGATSEAGAGAGGGVVCMFPLFHMAGWSIALGAWQARRAVHFAPADAGALLATAERHRAGRLYALPAVWARILEHGVTRYDLSALREADTGTSATPPELIAAIKAALPHTVTRVFYGSTEAGPATLLADRDLARKPGSVGLPQPGCEIELRDGEICVRSDFLFDGYFDNPEATAAALTSDGWYRTGDLGAVDADGYVSVIGRARDVIRSGGETIAPVEVEAVLAHHPSIREVAVVGVPDAEWGEIVTAVVVPHQGAAAPTLESLRRLCSDQLASSKHPRRLVVVAELPRTAATGQVQRTLLVERLLADLAQPPPSE